MSVFENLHNTTDKATDLGEKYIKTSRQYFRLKIFCWQAGAGGI